MPFTNSVKFSFILILSLSIILFHSCTRKKDEILLHLNWKAEPQFGGFYEADRRGFYQELGLSVRVLQGGAGTPVVQMVASGQAPYGIAAADEVLLTRDRGSDVIALFASFQKNPEGVMVAHDRALNSIREVFESDGILAIAPGAPYTLFLQKRFPNAKVKLVPYAGGIAGYLTERDYAQQCFVTAEPLLAEDAKKPAKTFLIADLGFDPYATVLITTSRRLRERPEEVYKMVAATRKGWLSYLDAPRATNGIMQKENPSMTPETFERSAKVQHPFLLGSKNREEFGKMDLSRWEELAKQLLDLKLIQKVPQDYNEVFRNL
jgi:NitT/TauT family transport system substrate-binding protein